MTLTELLLDALRLRLDTPTDPRDIILSDDNTVIHELQDMIRTAVQAEIGKLSDFMGPHIGTLGLTPVPEAPAKRIPELSHDNNTVIQESLDTPPSTEAPATAPAEMNSPAPTPATDKAAIVAMLQAMRDEGLSLREMAEQLQAENIPTLSGKGRWQKGTVDKLLHTAV